MTVPNTLLDIRNKVRRITGRPNDAQITDTQIDSYVNTYYIYDLSEQLRLESLRYNYQFVTNANQPTYDFPKELYLTDMPPVFIGGYQSYMTQSREQFFRVNPKLQLIQQVGTGNGTAGPYNFQLNQTPITPGWKPNPPGAYSVSVALTNTDITAASMNYNVIITAVDLNGQSMTLVDDGGCSIVAPFSTQMHIPLGTLFDVNSTSTDPLGPLNARGTINYLTGQVNIGLGFRAPVPLGNNITAQYIPYVASRPQTCVLFQDQIILNPIADQSYTVSFEAYKYPTALAAAGQSPQLNEWWQLLAYGAADKIFADNGDIENLNKFRPLLEEQLKLIQRRTIAQYSSERTTTIYTEQAGVAQYPFGNLFSSF